MRKLGCNRTLFLALGLAAVCADLTHAASWPRFRGPNGTGIALDKDIPVQWDKDSILWKVELPGLGNSSPVTWGDRIFLQSASTDGKERYMLCLSTADGKVLWKQTLTGTKARMHKKNSWASSTPATDGERAYALFWDGSHITLHAFDFQGKQLWDRDLGAFQSQHGPGVSPMVCEDKVILANDQDGTAVLQAFEAKTGKPAWQAERPAFRTCYSTPFLLEKEGAAPELIVASTAGITSYNPRTGKENWKWGWSFDGMALRTVASPVYGQGLIFANSGDGSGARHLVAVKAGGQGDVTQTNLAWEWKKTRPYPYVPCLLTWGEHLFFVNDLGEVGCVMAKTGDQVWTAKLSTKDVSASPILVNGKIYAIGEEGVVFVFSAGEKFELLAKNDMGEPVRATPAVADNRLYIRGQKHLYCIGKPGVK
jgi:outer membrane protein assembly factor BamB